MNMNRREMLQSSLSHLAYFSTLATTPNWIIKSANAIDKAYDDRILVILQHGGGLDGLNTVIPITDEIYNDQQTRPNLRVPKEAAINLDGLNAFHPKLPRLAEWFQKGMVGILQNVGYQNPNFSHFSSTDIYEFAKNPVEGTDRAGWVARFFDNECSGCEPGALDMVVAGKTSVPDSMDGGVNFRPPAINRPSDFSLDAHQDEALRLGAIQRLNSIQYLDSQLDFLQRSANAAQASVQDVQQAGQLDPLVPEAEGYLNDSLGRGLKLVSQIIRFGFKTKIFYVSQGGYDTHSDQVAAGSPLEQGRHPQLLGRMDQNLNAFLTEMEISGNLDRVLVMSFSEFGRRVRENGSRGTDHGAANCSFVFGGGIKGGVYGGQPDLADLIKGNLKHKVDFRAVYAQAVENWFGAEAAPIFGPSVYESIIATAMPKIDFVKQPANA